MSARKPTAVVVGASVAGVSAVRAFRAAGFDGHLILLGAEDLLPYDRPPLSKEFLAGTAVPADFALVTESQLADLQVDWRPGTVATGLRPLRRTVEIGTDEVVSDYVVIATGAFARTLPGTSPLVGLHTLRTLADARALRAELVPDSRLVVVGAGFIGSEVASTAAALGVRVCVLEMLPVPLAGPLGKEMGAVCAGLHADHGVELRVGVGVAGVRGKRRVTEVQLTDGSVLSADTVLVGAGCLPVTDWLVGSGLDLSGGVRTDAAGLTAVPGVAAVGDVACAASAWAARPTRVEHWTNAMEQPARAVAALLGAHVAAPPAPYFWSAQYGRRIQFAGHVAAGDVVRVVDGAAEDRSFLAVYERAGQPSAVLGMDQGKLFTRWRRQLRPTTAWEAA